MLELFSALYYISVHSLIFKKNIRGKNGMTHSSLHAKSQEPYKINVGLVHIDIPGSGCFHILAKPVYISIVL